ncbi:MAG TPA: hypothetical protein VM142_07100 [Acidimicrobiales bacterium]|nr:hypothetical protein [Acidimicrobiales bacterium]
MFLDTAEIVVDADVAATNAIHAAIAAADAICCIAIRQRSGDANHSAAVELLRKVDPKLASLLARSLNRKTQAAYELRDISKKDASACIRQATALVEAARTRIIGT